MGLENNQRKNYHYLELDIEIIKYGKYQFDMSCYIKEFIEIFPGDVKNIARCLVNRNLFSIDNESDIGGETYWVINREILK